MENIFDFDLDSLFKEILNSSENTNDSKEKKSITQIKFENRVKTLEDLFENPSDIKIAETFHIILQEDNVISTEIGEVFGKWTLIKWVFSDKAGNSLFLCRCECGNQQIVRYTRLLKNKSKQCKECHLKQASDFMKKINIDSQRARCEDMYIGEVFGKRIIVDIEPKFDRNKNRLVKCECCCGNQKWIRYSDLKHGKSKGCKSCGKSKD